MSENFLKFKRRLFAIRVIKALLSGVGLGFAIGGILHALSRLAVLPFEPWVGLAIGAGVLLVAAVVFFLLLGKSDKQIAEGLDKRFGLNERMQTMIAYKEDSGTLAEMQRADADVSLGKVRMGGYGLSGFALYLTAFILSLALLGGSFVVPDMRNMEEPEVIVPFTLSASQEAGIKELIAYVQRSDMESPYKEETVEVLDGLLDKLRGITTEPDMRVALAEAMAYILDITDRSSSAVEILNAVWSDGNFYLKHLARALDTSEWQGADDWGEFAERMIEYKAALIGDASEGEDTARTKLMWAIDVTSRNTVITLGSSGIPDTDVLYSAITALAVGEGGYASLLSEISELEYATMAERVSGAVDSMTNMLYEAVSSRKLNTDTGEYVMTRLATMFLVPLPEFERPDFVKNRETIEGETDEDDRNDEGGYDGGIGEGATFGSNDLVLDPLTGNYVEYGTLIHQYDALMYEKLESGSYTDEQKDAIKKYFALLYSGIKKEEGN